MVFVRLGLGIIKLMEGGAIDTVAAVRNMQIRMTCQYIRHLQSFHLYDSPSE